MFSIPPKKFWYRFSTGFRKKPWKINQKNRGNHPGFCKRKLSNLKIHPEDHTAGQGCEGAKGARPPGLRLRLRATPFPLPEWWDCYILLFCIIEIEMIMILRSFNSNEEMHLLGLFCWDSCEDRSEKWIILVYPPLFQDASDHLDDIIFVGLGVLKGNHECYCYRKGGSILVTFVILTIDHCLDHIKQQYTDHLFSYDEN